MKHNAAVKIKSLFYFWPIKPVSMVLANAALRYFTITHTSHTFLYCSFIQTHKYCLYKKEYVYVKTKKCMHTLNRLQTTLRKGHFGRNINHFKPLEKI